MKSNNIIWRLLRRNISPSQIIGYALANLVGLAIVITAIQFYRDISGVWTTDDGLITSDYLVISRKVGALGNLVPGAPSGFSADDIKDIESQPWTRRVGQFTASRFHVNASVNLHGRGMSTYMFFESIPDEFFDIKPSGWRWDPNRPEIPIVLSRDYLALYNFGFAATRGLPQISESMVSVVPLQVSVSGNGQEQTFPARVVGFSSRLNTIAVPQAFMDWANERYAANPQENPSRLIIEVTDPGNPDIQEYLDRHNYESAGDKANTGRANQFFAIVTSVVIAVGAIISILAFFILMLSIYLLIQKNRRKIHDLLLLGYTPHQVAVYYYRLVIVINAAVLAGASAVMLIGSHLWSAPLSALGAASTAPWLSLVIGAAIIGIITVINLLTIRRLTRESV